MRTLDKNETITWLSERGVVLDSSDRPTFSGLVEVMDSAIPADSGRKTALSKTIVSFFDGDDEALLWINEFGIWQSCDDRNLFEGFRRSIGENSPLYQEPGHIFSENDLRDVGSLLAMTLYFVWGAVLYSPGKGLAITISHDEFISVLVRDKKDAAGMTEILKKYLS